MTLDDFDKFLRAKNEYGIGFLVPCISFNFFHLYFFIFYNLMM